MAPGVEAQKVDGKVQVATGFTVDPASGAAVPSDKVPDVPVLKPEQFKNSTYLSRASKATSSNWGEPQKFTVTFDAGQYADGDTLKVGPYNCRITGIDAPETEHGKDKPGQTFGPEAGAFLKKLMNNKQVDVQISKNPTDKSHGRDLCQITFEGKDLSREMVANGFTWVYREYVKQDVKDSLLSAESIARNSKKGLWSQTTPQYPEDFRKSKW